MHTDNRMTTKDVSEFFKVSESTIRSWRRCRRYDKRYPRFHKLITGAVYYVREEIVEDLAKMEIEFPDRMEMTI